MIYDIERREGERCPNVPSRLKQGGYFQVRPVFLALLVQSRGSGRDVTEATAEATATVTEAEESAYWIERSSSPLFRYFAIFNP